MYGAADPGSVSRSEGLGYESSEFRPPVCADLAIAAAAGASGAKAWLQAHHMTWLTEARMRAATLLLVIAMLIVSSVAFSGTSKPDHGGAHTPQPAQSRWALVGRKGVLFRGRRVTFVRSSVSRYLIRLTLSRYRRLDVTRVLGDCRQAVPVGNAPAHPPA